MGSFLCASKLLCISLGAPIRSGTEYAGKNWTAALQGPHSLPGGHGHHCGMSAGSAQDPPQQSALGESNKQPTAAGSQAGCMEAAAPEPGPEGLAGRGVRSPSRQKECAHPKPQSGKAQGRAMECRVHGVPWAEDDEGRGERRRTRDKPAKMGWVRLRSSSGSPMSRKELF